MGRHVRFLFSRLLQFLISLTVLIFLSFGLLRFFPGSPLNDEKNLDPQVLASLQDFYGLQQGLLEQGMTYLRRLLSGDLGTSMHFVGRSVGSLIWEYGKLSALLGLTAFALALLASLLWTLLSRRWRKHQAQADLLLLILMSFPTMALGPFCIWLFAFQWQWLPVALLEEPKSYILPIFLLSLKPMLALTRVLSSSLDLCLRQDYIQTARSLGFSENQILLRWALRNSLTSFLAQAGPLFASLISGSFLIEVLFALPGLGFQFVESVLNRDWPLVLGLTLVYGGFLLVVQLVTDFLTFWADPRVEVL